MPDLNHRLAREVAEAFADNEAGLGALSRCYLQQRTVSEEQMTRAERAEAEIEQLRKALDDKTRWDLLESLCAWLLHRFGHDSAEGREASFRLEEARKHTAPLSAQEKT